MAQSMIPPGFRHKVTERITQLHDSVTELFTELDRGGSIREDQWEREGGGGGLSRALTEGMTFEKAGINRSLVEGTLVPELAQRIGAQGARAATFFVTTLGSCA